VTVLLVFLGGAAGAPARYVLDRLVARRAGGVFPWGTLTVNVIGSVILGALAGAGVGGGAQALLGTGVCGALTTFSTFGYETVRLAEDGAFGAAGRNVVVSLVLGLAASAAAFWAAASLT
jgi:CrcB protein